MIVRRDGEKWVVIRQMDHATHCGKLARAWREGPFGGPASVSPALERAAGFHDLGWTAIDQHVEVNADGTPLNFTQIDERRHTEFYSAAVREIAKTDAYAGYLVSLHATGLYSRRFGWAGLKPVDWTAIGPHGHALLEREQRFRGEIATTIAAEQVEFENAWRDYMLLETFDYLSLLTCFGLSSEGCGPVPTKPGQWENLKVERVSPTEVRITPYPFAGPLDVPVEASQWTERDGLTPIALTTVYR